MKTLMKNKLKLDPARLVQMANPIGLEGHVLERNHKAEEEDGQVR